MNWYKKIYKKSYRGNTPKMQDWDERFSDPYDKNPNEFQLTQPNPFFGGKTRRGYPDDYSFVDDDNSDYGNYERGLPTEDILMDQNPPTGEGANDERFVSHEEKSPIKTRNTIGPHNMQSIVNLHDYVSNKSKFRRYLNKV
ncbi:MAG: hypothetical protein ACOCRX_09830 [Candidatus Woesearchaeota archaeon]